MSSIGIPSNATSQAWIDVEHGEITLLVGKEKLKFNFTKTYNLRMKKRTIACG